MARNRQILGVDGETYWVHRSVAVCVIAVHNNKFLLNKRGKNAPDFQGCWNLPCGYLDFDETTKEAAARELFEECGVKVNPDNFQFLYVDDKPTSNKQNVVFHYVVRLDGEMETTADNADDGEVEEIGYFTRKEIENMSMAFNHKEIIQRFVI